MPKAGQVWVAFLSLQRVPDPIPLSQPLESPPDALWS